MNLRFASRVVWVVLVLSLSTAFGMVIVRGSWVEERFDALPVHVYLSMFLLTILLWEFLCRKSGSEYPIIVRLAAKYIFASMLLSVVLQIGEKLTRYELFDPGEREQYSETIIHMYIEHGLLRGLAMLVSLTSVIWSGAVGAGLVTLVKKATDEVRWRRGLGAVLAVSAAGGVVKVFSEAGLAVFDELIPAATFFLPLLVGLLAMSRSRALQIAGAILCLPAIFLWFSITMHHLQTYHASKVFFDLSFVAFGCLMCVLAVLLLWCTLTATNASSKEQNGAGLKTADSGTFQDKSRDS